MSSSKCGKCVGERYRRARQEDLIARIRVYRGGGEGITVLDARGARERGGRRARLKSNETRRSQGVTRGTWCVCIVTCTRRAKRKRDGRHSELPFLSLCLSLPPLILLPPPSSPSQAESPLSAALLPFTVMPEAVTGYYRFTDIFFEWRVPFLQ